MRENKTSRTNTAYEYDIAHRKVPHRRRVATYTGSQYLRIHTWIHDPHMRTMSSIGTMQAIGRSPQFEDNRSSELRTKKGCP